MFNVSLNKDYSGIYCYTDKLNNNEIVYIGKDSHINKQQRRKNHLAKSRYNDQPFNRIIQNNPNRYEYHVLCRGKADNELLNIFEKGYIETYQPRFNYGPGGDGRAGAKLTKEHKDKISKANKGKKVSKETREKISKANKGKPGYNKGKKVSKKTREKISKSRIGVYTDEKNPRWRNDIPSPQQLHDEWKSGTSQKELTEKYNCGEATIKRRIAKVKKEDGRYNPNIPNNEIIFNEWINGKTQKEIAEKYQCSLRNIENRIQKYKKDNNITQINPCNKNHIIRYDIPDGYNLLEEKEKYNLTYDQLAEKYNCTRSLISHRIRKTRDKSAFKHYTNVPKGQELLNEYENSDVTQRELAEKYNCSLNCIKNRIKYARKNN